MWGVGRFYGDEFDLVLLFVKRVVDVDLVMGDLFLKSDDLLFVIWLGLVFDEVVFGREFLKRDMVIRIMG